MNQSYKYQKLSLTKTLSGIFEGKINCLDVFDEHLASIKAHNPSLNALIYINEDRAKDELNHLINQSNKGSVKGRLHGIVFSAKDTVAVAGLPQSDGSIKSQKKSAPSNTTLVQKLVNEGAVCIGKSNMAERGKSYYTENPIYGRTNNPFDKERSPGGSGGGDSAAVAANFAQFGIGADAGGSVRVPAAFCGLFGLFPTRGLFSDTSPARYSHTIANLFRNNGVIAKSIDDIELLYNILKGYDALDPASVETPLKTLTEPAKKGGNFIFFDSINGIKADLQISSQVQNVRAKFESLGFFSSEGAPQPCQAAYEIYIILAGQSMLILDDILATQGGAQLDLSSEGKTLQNLRKRITTELPALTVENLLKCWHAVDYLRNQIAQIFTNYDFIICPVAATLPPLHDTSNYKIDNQNLQSQQVFQFASMVNVLGLPAIAFPVGVSKEGLPIGLQIIGPRFSEKRLIDCLRLAGYTDRVCYPTL